MKTAAKDFKMTELGPIPKDWEVKRLGELFDIGSSKRVFQSQWRDSGIPFWRARDIVSLNEGSGAIGGLYIDADLYSQYKSQYGVPTIGDLLVTAVGTLGEVYRVKDNKPFYFKDGNIIWLRNRGVCDSQFVEVLFAGGRLDDQIYDTAGGSTVGTYTITNANKTLIPLPPLPEQRKIAAALSDVDEMIAALEKLIEKKRKIKTGAMQRLLTAKTRLPGFKGAWVEKRLGEVGDVVTGSTPPRGVSECWGGDYNWISAKDFKGKYIVDSVEKITAKGKSFCRLLPAGSVLVTCIASIGLNAIAKKPSATNQQINAIICKACDHEFLYYQMDAAKDRMMELAGQTAVPIINKGDFEGLLVSFPPTLAEQKAIAKVLGDMDEEIAALEAELAKTRQLKQGMMQELLTGKVRLV